jgi:hypothetical protein
MTARMILQMSLRNGQWDWNWDWDGHCVMMPRDRETYLAVKGILRRLYGVDCLSVEEGFDEDSRFTGDSHRVELFVCVDKVKGN